MAQAIDEQDHVTSKAKLELEKTELEVKRLKEPASLETAAIRIVAFEGAAIVLSGTLLGTLRPPLRAQILLIVFYALGVLAILSSSLATFLWRVFFQKTASLISLSSFCVAIGLLSLSLFIGINLYSDWSEAPEITDISADRTLVHGGETIKLEANVNNPNQEQLLYEWSVDSGKGNWLDKEGNHAAWEAPAEEGLATVRLKVIEAGREIAQKEIAVDVQPESPVAPTQNEINFVSRCTKALDKGYQGNLTTNAEAFEAAVQLCDGAAKQDVGALALDDQALQRDAQSLSRKVPVQDLPKLVQEPPKSRWKAFWDRRRCCTPEFFLKPFCRNC